MRDLNSPGLAGTPRLRVLLADATQHAGNNDYHETLRNLPFIEVVAATKTSEDAISLFFKTKPDIVVVSIILPKEDGMEVLRCINRASADCAVILLSHAPNVFLEQAATLLGAVGLCSVPEGFAELRQLLERCWRRKFDGSVTRSS